MLESKEATIFKRKKGRDGKFVNEAKLIKAYHIDYLEPLTQEELDELARRQQAYAGIDED
jgi:hypothetical protein